MGLLETIRKAKREMRENAVVESGSRTHRGSRRTKSTIDDSEDE